MLDAARGASAARVTAVIPHYAYARSDKKSMPRVSIGGRLVADLLVTAGVSRVLAMTLHAPQVHGFFSVPVDHLHALRELADHFARPRPQQLRRGLARPGQRQAGRGAGPDARPAGGGGRQGAAQRPAGHDQLDHRRGGGPGRDRPGRRDRPRHHDHGAAGACCASASARSVRIACTHGLFSDGALERIAAQPEVEEIVCTNTVPIPARPSVGAQAARDLDRARRWPRPSGASTRASRSARCSAPAGVGTGQAAADPRQRSRGPCSTRARSARRRPPTPRPGCAR